MGKIPSLIFQMKEKLKSLRKFGESKKEARDELREEAKKQGVPLAAVPVPGIFSRETFNTYLKQCVYFIKYVQKNHPEVKLLDDAKQYAGEYLRYCRDRGDSAWTLKTVGPALAKLFDCTTKDFDFEFPDRNPLDRTRSATDTKYDAVIERNNASKIEFLRNTGLRRREAESLKLEQISDDFKHITTVGKGGKERTLQVIRPEVIEKYVKEHEFEADRLLEQLDKRMDIHSYRHDYANELYQKLLTEKYDRGEETEKWYRRHDGSGRKYDRDVLQEVSRSLGHERVDTAIANYIK